MHKLDNLKLASELDKQQVALTLSCNKAQAITEKVSHDYQSQIAALSSRVDDLKRMQHPECVSITPAPTAGHDASPSVKVAAGQGRVSGKVSYDKYVDLLAEGERYRLQLKACQSFVSSVEGQYPAQK